MPPPGSATMVRERPILTGGISSITFRLRMCTNVKGVALMTQRSPEASSAIAFTLPSELPSLRRTGMNFPFSNTCRSWSTPNHNVPARSCHSAVTSSPGKPFDELNDVIFPSRKASSECHALIHTVPSLVANTAFARSALRPSRLVTLTTRRSRKASMPRVVSTQSVPSRSSKKPCTVSPESPSRARKLQTVQALILRPDPRRVLTIDEHEGHCQLSAIQPGRDEWPQLVIHQVQQSK